MKRFAILPLLGLGVLAACADSSTAPTTASANVTQGAQYKSVSRDISTAPGTLGYLFVTFDESGMGNAAGSTLERVYYHVDALFACRNNGGNWPTDPKKQGVSFSGIFEQEFAVRNGRASGTLQIPVPVSTLSCPGGQRKTLVAIQWLDGLDQFGVFQRLRLVDTTNNVTAFLGAIARVLDLTYDLDTSLPQ